MAEGFTRRDFLDATLLASGGVLLGGASPVELRAGAREAELDGYGGIMDHRASIMEADRAVGQVTERL